MAKYIRTPTGIIRYDNNFTDELKAKLSTVEHGAQVNTVIGVKGSNETEYRLGLINITKDNIGLSRVDNTPDIEKNVNSAKTLTTGRDITIGNQTINFDGSRNIAYTLLEIGALPLIGGTMTGAINFDLSQIPQDKVLVLNNVPANKFGVYMNNILGTGAYMNPDTGIGLDIDTDGTGEGINIDVLSNTSRGININNSNRDAYSIYSQGKNYLDILVLSTMDITGNADINGTLNVDGATTLRSTLDVTDDVTLSNNLSVLGNADVSGTLDVTGKATLENDLEVQGNADITGTLDVTGAATFENNLTVQSNTDLSGTLDVTGKTTLKDNLEVKKNADVTGTLDVTGKTTLKDNLEVKKNSTIKGNSHIEGNEIVDGTLGVTGKATLSDQLDVTGAAMLRSTLGVTGNTTVGGTLNVTGKATLSDQLDVTKATTLRSTLTVTGNTTMGGTLGVTGKTTLSDQLDVTGATTLRSTLGVTSNATVGGTLGVTGNTTLSGTLGITGKATLSDQLDVTKATTLRSTLSVTGNTTLSSNLSVSGDTTVGGSLTISGVTNMSDLNLTDDVSIGGTLDVTGKTTLNNQLQVVGATTLDDILNVSGDATVGGTLGVTGKATLSDQLDVAKAAILRSTLAVTGNTTIGGTLSVTGKTTLSDQLEVVKSTSLGSTLMVTGTTTIGSVSTHSSTTLHGNLYIKNGSIDKFTVAYDTGNTNIAGTLNVGGKSTLTGGLDVTGAINASGDIEFPTVTSTAYPAKSNMIKWSGSNDGAQIYYRVDASNAGRLVFNLTDDTNTLIAFALNGTDFATIDTSGNYSKNAATASKWATARTITLTGSVTGSVSIDGSGNVSLATTTNHTHNYAGSSSAGGAANSANKLNTDAGNATTPVYFSNGIPVALGYTIEKSVPSNAVFTDTHYTTHLYVGASNGTANATTANGSTYFILMDDNTVRDRRLIKGDNGVSLSSNASGEITIINTGVRSVTINNNKLRVNTNGTSNDLTIPYATTAAGLDDNVTISLGNHASGSVSFNTSGDYTLSMTLADSGVTANTYGPSANVTGTEGTTISVPQITVDRYGRVTSITNRTYTSKDTTYTIPTSLKNPNLLTVNYGTTKLFDYDGSSAKTLSIKEGTNISVTGDTSGNITITNTGVRSVSINGNYLRVNTNGTNSDLTIPYATSAGSAGSVAWSNVSDRPTNLNQFTNGPGYTTNTGTVTSVATGVGLTGGTITTSGTIKVKLRSETALTNDSAAATETAGRIYPVVQDKSGYLAVNVPWENTTYSSKAAASGGTDVSLVTTGEKATWNAKSNLTIGTTATTAAAGNHTHSTSIATSTGTNQLTLAFGTKYAITTGGTSYIFTMPSNPNTDTKVTAVGNHYAPSADNDSELSVDASSTTAATWNSTSLVTGVNIQRDAKGHVVGVTVDSIKMPANPNTNTDVNVTQTATNTNANYEVLFSATADNTTRTETARKYSNFLFNPSTGNLQVTQLNGVTVGSSPKFTDTNTTYSAGTGISLSGTTFSNSGVRSIATGSTNGTISVNTNGTSADVAVKGLGSAAYTASTAYAAASHTHNELSATDSTYGTAKITLNSGRYPYISQTGSVSLGSSGNQWTAVYAKLLYEDGTLLSNIYAALGHTHTTSIATSTGTNQLTLAFGTKYAISAGGTSYVFTMPANPNTWRPVGTGATDAAAGNHTHSTSIATSTGTNQLTLAFGTKYAITAGGTSYVFTMPANPNTNTWRGIQDNLTSSTNTTESLSAKQGYLLANGSARDSTKLPLDGGTMTGTLTMSSAQIVTPGSDSYGIRPATANYGRVGTSDYYYYEMHTARLYAGTIYARGTTSNPITVPSGVGGTMLTTGNYGSLIRTISNTASTGNALIISNSSSNSGVYVEQSGNADGVAVNKTGTGNGAALSAANNGTGNTLYLTSTSNAASAIHLQDDSASKDTSGHATIEVYTSKYNVLYLNGGADHTHPLTIRQDTSYWYCLMANSNAVTWTAPHPLAISLSTHNTTLNVTSDRRLKDHIKYNPEEESIGLLRAINTAQFTYKSEPDVVTNGCYAQDVIKYLKDNNYGYRPYLIINMNDSETTGKIFTNNIYEDEDNVTYGLDYGRFVPELWTGWRYHDRTIQQLTDRIKELEDQIAQMNKK